MNQEVHKNFLAASRDEEICVCAVGARTPLGFDSVSSAAAVRAAISAVTLHPFFVDKAEDPISIAKDCGLEPDAEIVSRLKQMLLSAVEEACGDRSWLRDSLRVHCWVGLPEPRAGLPQDMASSICSAFASNIGLRASCVHALPRGHASGLMAMQAAADKILSGEADFCLAAGVDSYHDRLTLKWLDSHGSLMSASNRSGFPPGEAAGACLLMKRATAELHGMPILARITAAATSIETCTIRGSGVCVGEGLSAALRGASSSIRLPEEAITATYCDINGERYRSEEFLYTLLRTQDLFVDANDYQCPSDCWGDVGAASGPLFLCLAVASSERNYAKGARPILWAGSYSGHRTAVLLALGDKQV